MCKHYSVSHYQIRASNLTLPEQQEKRKAAKQSSMHGRPTARGQAHLENTSFSGSRSSKCEGANEMDRQMTSIKST
jgi:hypothetical protein